uniref:Uncharacterized protein n=1 Tax=Panagrellus redivivus TaxID=6233 RepID=A0A7E4W830_PANRE
MPPAAPEGPSPPSKCSFHATIHPSATSTDPTTTHPELYQHATSSTTSLRHDPDQINRSDSTIRLHLLDHAPRPPSVATDGELSARPPKSRPKRTFPQPEALSIVSLS